MGRPTHHESRATGIICLRARTKDSCVFGEYSESRETSVWPRQWLWQALRYKLRLPRRGTQVCFVGCKTRSIAVPSLDTSDPRGAAKLARLGSEFSDIIDLQRLGAFPWYARDQCLSSG